MLAEIGFDVREIFQFAIDVLRGGPLDAATGSQIKIYSAGDQRWAAEFLRDSVYGKPAQAVALNVTSHDAPGAAKTVDLESLSEEELDAYLDAQEKASRVLVAATAMRMIDATSTEPDAPKERAERAKFDAGTTGELPDADDGKPE